MPTPLVTTRPRMKRVRHRTEPELYGGGVELARGRGSDRRVLVKWDDGTQQFHDRGEIMPEGKTMKITKSQLRRIIREELEREDPEVIRVAGAIAAAIDGSNIKPGAASWAFDDVISDALSDFDTDNDFLRAVEKHFRANKKTGRYSDRAAWAGPAYIGSKIAWSTPGFAQARLYADLYGS